jgi:predicted Zn-dependent protease
MPTLQNGALAMSSVVFAGSGGSNLYLRRNDLTLTAEHCAAPAMPTVALTIASNAAADLVRAGKLDEAEKTANDLLVQFSEVHDGYDRLGMVHEARGDNIQAAECYRKVIAFIKKHPDDYEPGFEDTFVTLINRLDPPAET